jgi:hypothetical protein
MCSAVGGELLEVDARAACGSARGGSRRAAILPRPEGRGLPRVLINTHFMLVSEMPHGGFKRSGYGKDLSVYALEDYSVPRHVMVKL